MKCATRIESTVAMVMPHWNVTFSSWLASSLRAPSAVAPPASAPASSIASVLLYPLPSEKYATSSVTSASLCGKPGAKTYAK